MQGGKNGPMVGEVVHKEGIRVIYIHGDLVPHGGGRRKKYN